MPSEQTLCGGPTVPLWAPTCYVTYWALHGVLRVGSCVTST
jgi:hypothetical protein